MLLNRVVNRVIRHFAVKLGVVIHNVRHQIACETLPKFGNKPENVVIELPRRIINPHRIFLGNDIWLGQGSFLMAVTCYPGPSIQYPNKTLPTQQYHPTLTIGNRVTSTANLQIVAAEGITIEDDVIFASNIHINDSLHGYEDTHEPYKYQKLSRIAPITIKRGCWIGQNVVILPGVTIGEYSIVGANSVVTDSLPDRCIAFGNSAKVVKIWDANEHHWVHIKNGVKPCKTKINIWEK